MKSAVAALALLTGFAAAQSVNVANLFLDGSGDLTTGSVDLDVISFTLDEDTDHEVSCSALHDLTIPTGRISGGCQTIPSGAATAFEFSLDEITGGSNIKLTLWNTENGAEHTGSAVIPNVCQHNGPPSSDGFFCDQEEPEDDIIVLS